MTQFSDLNSLTLSGRLGKDPQYSTVGNGNVMAKFSIASTQRSVDEFGGYREKTTWVNVVAWGDVAKLVKGRLKKGDHVTLVGRLEIDRVVEEATGIVKFYTKMVLESYQKNDRSNDKRNSGHGNGAVEGSHPSQRTIADRFDNQRNPDVHEMTEPALVGAPAGRSGGRTH